MRVSKKQMWLPGMEAGEVSSSGSDRALVARPETKETGWFPDPYMCMACAVLMGVGLVALYSSSAAYAARMHHSAEYFLFRQALWLCVGVVGMVLVCAVPLRVWKQSAVWAYACAVLLCVLVLVPGIGHYVGGARRWLVVSFVTVQPSEWAKYAAMLLVASLLAGRSVGYARGWGQERLAIPFILAQIPVALILAEPDLGTALVLEMVVLMMVFVGGIRGRVFAWFGVLSLPVLYHVLLGTPFRLRRLLGYLDPWAYRTSVGYQVTEALISIGSGGVTGVGLGDGKQKLFFLPEAHTDFIFAILAEELGLIGVYVLLCAFGVLVWRGARLAVLATEPFQRYVALGSTLLIGVPAVFNVCVVTGLLPTKGLPLPLVSYGGSHTVMALLGVGMLLRVGREQGEQR